jgi:hypothetical protein
MKRDETIRSYIRAITGQQVAYTLLLAAVAVFYVVQAWKDTTGENLPFYVFAVVLSGLIRGAAFCRHMQKCGKDKKISCAVGGKRLAFCRRGGICLTVSRAQLRRPPAPDPPIPFARGAGLAVSWRDVLWC